MSNSLVPLKRVPTGIPNLDAILEGGLIQNSINVVAGPPGTGKTVLAQQIVFNNANATSRMPYLVTVSEPTVKILRFSQNFAFFDPDMVGDQVIYLDIGSTLLEGGLEAVTDQIEAYTKAYSPTILAIDSFKAIHEITDSAPQIREFTYRLAISLTTWGTTTLLIGEYNRDTVNTEPIFAIADTIIYMDQESRGMNTFRTLEVLKMRGSGYFAGKHPFRISDKGMIVYPRLRTTPFQNMIPSDVGASRISLGINQLNAMMSGGPLSATTTLVAGSAGTGKTLLGLHFLLEGISRGEPGLMVTFQETPTMLASFARGFGWDLVSLQKEGLLHVLYTSPVELSVDEHTHMIRSVVESAGIRRIVMDSLKDLESATMDKARYKDYVYSLASEFRYQGITSLMTSEIPELFGPFTVSEHGISFVADNVIILRYVELAGRVARAISVMKMRGSDHDKAVREYRITADTGLGILHPFEDHDKVLTGTTTSNTSMLPLRARRLLRILSGTNGLPGAELSEQVQESPTETNTALETLVQLGYLIRQEQGGIFIYRTTIA